MTKVGELRKRTQNWEPLKERGKKRVDTGFNCFPNSHDDSPKPMLPYVHEELKLNPTLLT